MWCSYVIAILGTRAAEDSTNEILKSVTTAYFLRAKANAGISGRMKYAMRDADMVREKNASQGEQLMRDLEMIEFKRKRADKILVKEVSKWVNDAMRISEELPK